MQLLYPAIAGSVRNDLFDTRPKPMKYEQVLQNFHRLPSTMRRPRGASSRSVSIAQQGTPPLPPLLLLNCIELTNCVAVYPVHPQARNLSTERQVELEAHIVLHNRIEKDIKRVLNSFSRQVKMVEDGVIRYESGMDERQLTERVCGIVHSLLLTIPAFPAWFSVDVDPWREPGFACTEDAVHLLFFG